jgi:cytochrome c oxidase assembly factor CtaG
MSEHAASAVAAVAALTVLGTFLVGVRRFAPSSASLPRGLRRAGPGRFAALLAGLGTGWLAVSPAAERLADTGLAGHMTQHMALIVVAAPLLAAGAPGTALVLALPVRWRAAVARWRHAARRMPVVGTLFLPVTAWLAHLAALWLWHLPVVFDAAQGSPLLHGLEHASFLLTAWAYWWHLLSPQRHRLTGAAAVGYVFATMLPMTALGAVITFAGSPLYPDTAAHVVARGADPMTDQQLAGLVMWVPTDVMYLLTSVALFLPWLSSLDPTGGEAPEIRPDLAGELR